MSLNIDEDVDVGYRHSKINKNIDKSHYINRCFENGTLSYDEKQNKIDIKGLLDTPYPVEEENLKPLDKEQLRILLESKEILERLNQCSKTPIQIDTSEVRDMSMLFYGIKKDETIDLSSWDVSNVENMCMMFYGTEVKTTGLENWNVSKVRNMRWMLEDNDANREVVKQWKNKKRLNKDINEEEIFFKSNNDNQ